MTLILTNGTGGGLASQTTSWSGGVIPVEDDSVQILSGDIIEVDGIHIWGDATATALTIDNGGELTMTRTGSSEIDIKGGVVQHGTLSVGSMASPFPSNIRTRISWNYQQPKKAFSWMIEADGSIIINGSEKTLQTRATTTLADLDTTVTVDDATGWDVGDTIWVANTHKHRRGKVEDREITAISGNTITFTPPLDFDRDYLALVTNATQRIQIKCRSFDESSKLRVSHNDTDTPSTTRFLSRFEIGNTDSGHNGESGFCIYGNTELSTVAWKAPLSFISSHRNDVPNKYWSIYSFGFSQCDHLYNPEVHDCLWQGSGCVWARTTTKFHRCAWIFGNFKTTHGECLALEFTDCYFGAAALSNLDLRDATAPTLTRCKFECGFMTRNIKSSPTYIECSHLGWYFLPSAARASSTRIIRHTMQEGEGGSQFYPDTHEFSPEVTTHIASPMYILDYQLDPTQQYLYQFEGSFLRDKDFFRTKLASVRLSSRNQPNYPLKVDIPAVATVGVPLNVTLSIYIDETVTVPVTVVLSNSFDSADTTLPLTVGWHDISIGFLPTTTVSTTLRTTVTDGKIWIDDIIINGREFDLGTRLFSGGTEVSTVIDITNTSVPILAPNLIDGSRVQICNVTTEAELDNSVVTGGSGYSLSLDLSVGSASIGDIIRLRACHQSGLVAYYPVVSVGVLTSAGVTWINEQVIDEQYGSIGVDGESVDLDASPATGEIRADFANIQIDVDDPDNVFDARKGVAWWRYITTTEEGIRIYPPEALQYNPDIRNILVDSETLQIENVKPEFLTVVGGLWVKKDGGSIIAPTSNTIVWVPDDRVYQGPETGTSGLTSAESAKLSSLSTTNLDMAVSDIPAAVWDRAVSSSALGGTFGELVGKKVLTLSKWLGLK